MKENQWSYKPLSALCGINLGSTPSRSKGEYWGKGYSWVSISDLKEKYISKTKEEITDVALAESNCKIVKKGTLLMSFKLSIGKLAFAEKDLFTNEAIVALPIRDESELLKEYLYYVLKSIPLVGGNQAAMGQTLNKQSLSVLQIPIPPTLDDQKRIAKVLSQCEVLIQKRRESIDFLDDLLNSTFMNMFGDIRTNSRNIPQEKLGKLFGKGFLVDGPFGSAIKVDIDYVDHGTIPIIRTKNIKRFQFSDKDLKFILEEKYEQINRSNVIPGDILISKVGTIGNVCLFPDKFPKAVLSTTGSSRIRNTRKDINTNYLLYYLDRYKELMINRASDGVLKFLTLGHIRDFNILIPDISDQVKFSDLVKKVEAAKNTYSDSLKELENLYGSIGQKSFKGLLNLNKVDISDMEDLKKKDLEEVKEIKVEETAESLKKKADLLEIIDERIDDDSYLSKNCRLYIEKSKVLRSKIYSLLKEGEINVIDFKNDLTELNTIGEQLHLEVREYTPWQIDQHKSVERYIPILSENVLDEYPNLNIFSRNEFDYSSMSLDDYYGIPDEIVTQYGSIENQTMDLEFFFKKYFSNRSFTIESLENTYNEVVYERGDYFKYEEMKEFIFKSLEGPDNFFTQVFEEVFVLNPDFGVKTITKQIKLKVVL